MGATVAESAAADRLLTQAVGLVDRSERGKLALTGQQAKELLSGQVTNDIEALSPGTGCYAALLTNKGKMLADMRVLDCGQYLDEQPIVGRVKRCLSCASLSPRSIRRSERSMPTWT